MEPGFKISELTAFIATEKDGTEGIVGMQTKSGWLPLIGADTERIAQLKPIAKSIAEESGVPVMMARFSIRTNLELL